MFEQIAGAGAWFSRIFKVLRHGNAIVKEHDAAVAPLILLVRNIHDGILSRPFDVNQMRGYLQRLSNSEDAAWSEAYWAVPIMPVRPTADFPSLRTRTTADFSNGITQWLHNSPWGFDDSCAWRSSTPIGSDA